MVVCTCDQCCWTQLCGATCLMCQTFTLASTDLEIVLVAQSQADTVYFLKCTNRSLNEAEEQSIGDGILKAYRWQYIVSGIQDPRFTDILAELITDTQMTRITTALSPLM